MLSLSFQSPLFNVPSTRMRPCFHPLPQAHPHRHPRLFASHLQALLVFPGPILPLVNRRPTLTVKRNEKCLAGAGARGECVCMASLTCSSKFTNVDFRIETYLLNSTSINTLFILAPPSHFLLATRSKGSNVQKVAHEEAASGLGK